MKLFSSKGHFICLWSEERNPSKANSNENSDLLIVLTNPPTHTMLRRASRGVIFLTKSRVKNLCENVLSEERYLSLYPPPVDIIEQKAHVRAQFQQAVKLLAVAARNKSTSKSIYNDDDSEAVKDIVSLTKEDVASGELSTEQLMQLAKLRFTGNDSSRNTKNIGDESSQGSDLKDPELAVQAWTLASKQGNTDAAYSLAFCLLNGIGTERDEEEAFRLMFPLADSYDNAYAHVSGEEMWREEMQWICVYCFIGTTYLMMHVTVDWPWHGAVRSGEHVPEGARDW